MIQNQIATGKQMALRGLNCSTPSKVISLPTKENVVDFCPCGLFCAYKEDVFVFPTDITDEYRNDYNGRILITLKDTSSSYQFFIVDSSGVETELIDDTYGELFDVGFNLVQPLKVGYRIDWVNVFLNLGGGLYTLKVSQTDFDNTVTKSSHSFNVRLFDEIASNNSVKIETVQKGTIENGEDYGGMEWKNMVRVDGTFGNETAQFEQIKGQDSSFTDYDIQTSTWNNYTLQTHVVNSATGDELVGKTTLTDEIFISNYKILGAYKQYRRTPVVFEGTAEASDDYTVNTNKAFNITFKDKQTKVKRNFV
jgi:hypothetical protein